MRPQNHNTIRPATSAARFPARFLLETDHIIGVQQAVISNRATAYRTDGLVRRKATEQYVLKFTSHSNAR